MKLALKHRWSIFLMLTILIACKKQDLIDENPAPPTTIGFGAVEDSPEKLKQVPLIISNRYLALRSQSGSKKGRGGSTGTTTDITAPAVTITSPADASNISGNVGISVTASDNVGVSSVTVLVDGNSIATLTTAPYNITWSSSNVADGLHTITAKAVDAAGNWSSHSVTVTKNTTVVNPPPPSTTPTSYFLQTPPVGYQGGEGSCMAFSIGYGARSIEYYYRSGASSFSYSSNIFSPEFIYNQTKFGDCGAGTSVTTVLDLLKNSGVCTWSAMPYSYTNGCSLMPTADQLAEAANYKISGYSWLYSSDITSIKTLLLQNHPVIVTIVPDQAFVSAGPGFIWSSYTSSKTAGHAVVICGYDDSKQAYRIMNSWGTNWGDGGYSWISYDFLPYAGSGIAYVMN